MSKVNNFKDLGKFRDEFINDDKKTYQLEWNKKMNKFRRMVSQKNKKWLSQNKSKCELQYETSNQRCYERIEEYFATESKRKFMLHIITNFFPLDNAKQVPKIVESNQRCQLSDLSLTGLNSIMTGEDNARNKHIGFTGFQTNVILSGEALVELERFVLKYVDDYQSPNGQIINYALDQIRTKK